MNLGHFWPRLISPEVLCVTLQYDFLLKSLAFNAIMKTQMIFSLQVAFSHNHEITE